jgi:hypothetical protein
MYKLNPDTFFQSWDIGGFHNNRVQSGQSQRVTSLVHKILETPCCFKKNFIIM